MSQKIPAPPKEELEKRYLSYGATISQVAREYNVSNPVLRNWLKSYKIPLKNHKEASTQANNRNRNNPPAKEVLESLYSKNSIDSLESIFSVGQQTIYKWLDDYNIERKTLSESCVDGKRRAWERMIPSKDEVLKVYDEVKCIGGLQQRFDLSATSIKKLLTEYNIEIIKAFRSSGEVRLYDELTSLGFQWEVGNRSIIKPYELDMVNHDYKLAVEYCGLYWHSEYMGEKDRSYHQMKMRRCKELGYDLITVFETDDITKIISLVKNKLGVNIRIYARNCNIIELNSTIASDFNNSYHLHGHHGGLVHLGLYYENELIQVLTMCKSRFSKDYEWECSRMTLKSGITVIGGASKLFSYFIKNYDPKSIITFADMRFGQGRVYEKCGFTRLADTGPNYWYFNRSSPSRLYSRIAFQKHKLKQLSGYDETLTEWEIMKASRYDRIWDCGNAKYIWYK